jgi:hypothetical protein
MGTIFMMERLAIQGLRASSVTYVSWSVAMLLGLPA